MIWPRLDLCTLCLANRTERPTSQPIKYRPCGRNVVQLHLGLLLRHIRRPHYRPVYRSRGGRKKLSICSTTAPAFSSHSPPPPPPNPLPLVVFVVVVLATAATATVVAAVVEVVVAVVVEVVVAAAVVVLVVVVVVVAEAAAALVVA